MPARTERLTIVPAEEGLPGQTMAFPLWWDRRGFFEKYREREVDTGNPFTVDYAFLLTAGEALEWDKQCRLQFLSDPGSLKPWIESGMQQLESALRMAKWVIVESYEWESGLS